MALHVAGADAQAERGDVWLSALDARLDVPKHLQGLEVMKALSSWGICLSGKDPSGNKYCCY